MKLAIGSDDQITIRRGHFGESKYYLVYEIKRSINDLVDLMLFTLAKV